MYQLLNLKSGEVICVEKPRYVRLDERGVWIQCDEQDAQCISVYGNRFSIANKPVVKDAPEVVAVMEIDTAIKISEVNINTIQNAKNLDEVKAAVQDLLWAVADIYENGLN